MSEFSFAVGEKVADEYEVEGGGSLCFNLIEQDVVDMKDGLDVAARIVAQHLLQA